MKRLTTIALAILFSVTTISARTIQGEVRSDSDSTAVVGATCRLMSGGQFIDGVTTDDRGAFEISTGIKSKLMLEISMPGFNSTDIVIETDKNY